jgi:hypothetical protein
MTAILLALSLVAPVEAREPRSVEDILGSFKEEPEVREVQEMVLSYSKTDPSYVDAWLRASVTAAWLPELQLTYDYDNGYDRDYNYLTSLDDGFTGAADAEIEGSGVDLQHGVQVRAKWELDKLVMSSERIRVISEAQDVVKLRDKVLEEVTRLYFDRRRLQVDMLLTEGDAKTQLKNELRLQELTAQLDAYTGGRFSESLKPDRRR